MFIRSLKCKIILAIIITFVYYCICRYEKYPLDLLRGYAVYNSNRFISENV